MHPVPYSRRIFNESMCMVSKSTRRILTLERRPSKMAVRGKIDGTLFLVISVAGANSTSGFSLLPCCPVPGGRGD
eukprot:scaffold18133_cov81-Skeletonema_dohrnii-CCMP3373.AAC.1